MSLTGGLTLNCAAGKPAGIRAFYLIDKADFMSATLASGSTSTFETITLESGATWKKFEFEQDQAEMRENVEGERGSYKVTHEVEIYLPGITVDNRDAIQDFINNSACGFVSAVTDNNNVTWILGYSTAYGTDRPLRLLTDETTTAKALGEIPGSTVTFQSIDSDKACKTTATIVTE